MLTYLLVQSENCEPRVSFQLEWANSRKRRAPCIHRFHEEKNSIAIKGGNEVIRKLNSGKYRLYSRKADPRTGKRRNLGTFGSRAAAEKHERAVQYFKHH